MKTFGRKGVSWDQKAEDILGLKGIVEAIDWLANQLGIESFAKRGTNVVLKIRKAMPDAQGAVSLGKYRRSTHVIVVMNRNNTKSQMLSTFVHELVHAFQYKDSLSIWFPVVSEEFILLAQKTRYAGTTQGKKYLAQPVEIQAFATQYKYLTDVLSLPASSFSGNRIECYRKIGIDILNIL